MSTKKEELVAIAREGGYEGDMPGTTAEAIKVAAGYVGGGGSGGGADIMFVEFTNKVPQQTGANFTSSKTAEEVYNHVMGGGIAFIQCPYLYDESSNGVEARTYLLQVCQVVKYSDSNKRTFMVGGACPGGDGFSSYIAEIADNKNGGTIGFCVGY